MLRVGLTGPAGAGKSTAAAVFADEGVPVIDADRVAHELYVPGSELLRRLAGEFGEAILDSSGGLDRAALGAVVFADREKLAKLGRIVHPLLLRELEARLADLERGGEDLAVVEAALLLKWGPPAFIDVVVGVDAARPLRRARLVAAGMAPETAEARLDAQVGGEELARASDVLIRNDGSPEELREAVLAVLDRLRGKRGRA